MKNLFGRYDSGKWPIVFACLFLMLGTTTILHAQAPADTLAKVYTTNEDPADMNNQTNFGPIVLRTVVSLIAVVGVVFLGMYFLKHVVYRKKTGGLSIRVVGSTLLGPKKGIYLVEVEERRLLLGVTEASVSLLTELEKKSSDEAIYPAGSEDQQIPGKRFRELFESLVKKRGSDG